MGLSFWWVLPARGEAALGQRVLRCLSTVPEARPRRIGSYEPQRMALPPDDDAPFLALWREEMAYGGMLLWKASTPFRDGWVSFPRRREESWEGLRGREKAVSLTVRVRPSGYRDAEGREALVRFFATVANRLGAVYATGALDDGDVHDAGVQPEAGVPGHLVGQVLVGSVWVGLPPERTWLQWFGGPYVSELSDLPTIAKVGKGLLLRRGEEPALGGSLPGPPIPARLCFRARTPQEYEAHRAQQVAAIAMGTPTRVAERVPADVLPVIGSSRRRPSQPSVAGKPPVKESVDASPRLLWKDEDGPGWPGGGHPQRVGPAWIQSADGSVERLDNGAWMTRAEAQKRAANEGYPFEEV